MTSYTKGFLISSILYTLYVQFDDKMGNIWLRRDSDNNLVFVPYNLLSLIIAPLNKSQLWNPKMWDINFFTFSLFFTFNYVQFSKLINYIKLYLSKNTI